MSDYIANVMSLQTFFSKNPSNPGEGYDIKMQIPELQRSFVWDPIDQVKGFWLDMQDHRLASETTTPKIREMFGGTIVLYTQKNPHLGAKISNRPKIESMLDPDIENLARTINAVNAHDPFNKTEFIKAIEGARDASEVIDGQQRLTVMMIGAKVLQEIGKAKGCQKNIQADLRKVYWKSSAPRLLHLGTDEVDDFKNILENHTGVDELTTGWSSDDVTPIQAAYQETLKFFVDPVEGIIGGRAFRKIRWSRFCRFFLRDTSVVVLETTEFHQSHLVFKSLNHKGRKLRTSELFKSILFHYSALNENPANQTRVKGCWDRIVKNCNDGKKPSDPVSSFLYDWCKSLGLRRNDITGKADDSGKELREIETLDMLEKMLKEQCPRGQNNTGNVLKFTRNLEAESVRYDAIWNPTQSSCSGLTTQWMDLIDLRRIYTQGGLTPILLYILRQNGVAGEPAGDGAMLLNGAIRVLIQCTIFAVTPDQRKLDKDEEKPAQFAKTTRTWIKALHGESTSAHRLSKLKQNARNYLESENLYPSASGKRQRKWVSDINKKWVSLMKKSGLKVTAHPKLLLRYIESIDCIPGSPLNYTANYDKDRLQAEHIFPKSRFQTMAASKKSDWQKEWESVPSLWPIDDDERNAMKNLLGNFILLEKEINNSCNVRTWKGWPKPTKAPSYTIPKKKSGKNKGKQNFDGLGKIHYYKSLEWADSDLTGPLIAGIPTTHVGSHLKSVASVVSYGKSVMNWGQVQVNNRTKTLLEKAIGSTTCPDINLNYLW